MKRSHDTDIPSSSRSVKRRAEKIQVGETLPEKRLISGHTYYNSVDILPDRFNSKAFSFGEILNIIRPSLSLHFNFMIDVHWLSRQYPSQCRETPISLVVGQKMGSSPAELRQALTSSSLSNVTVHSAKLPIPFGTHHTKLSLLETDTSIHIIVSTANLIPNDWSCKTQCFYYATAPLDSISPTSCPFKDDLVAYLKVYDKKIVEYWVSRLEFADFGNLPDRLIYSFPGYHTGAVMNQVGHLSLRGHLSHLPPPPPTSRPLLVAQSSSIGSLGPMISSWLLPQLCKSLKGGRSSSDSRIFVIYPCVEDVRGSIEGYEAGCSLPYQKSTSDRQSWLRSIVCKWRAENTGRSRAMPHCKSYCEMIEGKPRWMVITSANLSKAAWGEMQKNCTQLMTRSYEMGVLVCDPERILVPYDYPILKYASDDNIWLSDVNYIKPDSLGDTWIVK